MSLSKRLRAQPKVVTEKVKQRASSPFGGAASSGATITILNPTDDAEVERLLALAGPARGVVITVRDDLAAGDRPERTRVHLTVRPRMHGGALGPEAALTVWVGWKVAALLEPGLEIPIQLNRTSGVIDAIATDQLARELAPRADEAKHRRPLPSTAVVAPVATRMPSATPAAVVDHRSPLIAPPSGPVQRGPGVAVTDPVTTPIGDVGWHQFVAVHAELNVRHPDGDPDAVAQRHGVAPGGWAAADSAWTERVLASPALATRLGADLDAAERSLRPH